MTKIKDLATVIVDNAFLQFPVDSERYELAIYISNYIGANCIDGLVVSLEPRVNRFMKETEQTITRALISLNRTLRLVGCNADEDRAKRLCVSLSNFGYSPLNILSWNDQEKREHLWFVISDLLRDTEATVGCSPVDWRLPK